MTIKRFEDLDVWKLARELVRDIYRVSRGTMREDRRFRDQLTGAAVSIMNKIAEGFDSQSTRECIRFLVYSRRSCSEVQNCFYVALDCGYLTRELFGDLSRKAETTRKASMAFLRISGL